MTSTDKVSALLLLLVLGLLLWGHVWAFRTEPKGERMAAFGEWLFQVVLIFALLLAAGAAVSWLRPRS
jgi:hypothetical protein